MLQRLGSRARGDPNLMILIQLFETLEQGDGRAHRSRDNPHDGWLRVAKAALSGIETEMARVVVFSRLNFRLQWAFLFSYHLS